MKKIFLFCLVIAFAFTAKISFAQTQITFYTSMGTFVAEMYDTLQPITAGNFIKLVEKNFYDGIIFHRVVKNFVIQGLTRNPVAVNPLFQRGQGVLVPSDFSDVGDAEQANTGCHSCACRNLVYSAVLFKI